jgi:hypothetical protein
MELSSPLDAVASAVHHAAHTGLPDVHYRTRDFAAAKSWSASQLAEASRNNSFPLKDAQRRPEVWECEVYAMFAQTWGSTALGFGGIGGAAMTPAYTVIVRGPDGHLAVYFGLRLAYVVDWSTQTEAQRKAFDEDVAKRWTVNVIEAVSRYGATEPRRRG